MVANELHIDIGSSFQASQIAAKTIMTDMLKIDFLEPLAFMISTAKVVHISDPNELLKHPEDITFLKLRCTMDGESQDKRATIADTRSFQFFLWFPQHEMDVASEVFTLVSMSPNTRKSTSGISRSLGSCFSAASSGNIMPPFTPTSSTTGGNSFTSLAMKLFLSMGSDPSKIIKIFTDPSPF